MSRTRGLNEQINHYTKYTTEMPLHFHFWHTHKCLM